MAAGLNRRRACTGLNDDPGKRSKMPRLADQLRRRNARRACEHIDGIGEPAEPRAAACEECGVQRSLRVCLSCGHVGCCDSSAPRHATAHHEATGHPVMRSVEAGEDWRWCYPDELLG